MKKILKSSLLPILIILVLGFSAYDLNDRFVSPIKDKIIKTEGSINIIKNDKIVAQNIIDKLNGDSSSNPNEILKLYNLKIPNSSSLPEVIDLIDSLAKSNFLKWESGTPAPQKVFDETLPEGVNSWSFGMTFTGDYAKIYNFIDSISILERLVTIESFTLQREQGIFRLNLSLRFYAEEVE